jgi:hypothetical protein
MWRRVVLSLMCLFSVATGVELRGARNETVLAPIERTAAIKPWYRNAAEKELAVRLGAGLNVTDV